MTASVSRQTPAKPRERGRETPKSQRREERSQRLARMGLRWGLDGAGALRFPGGGWGLRLG